MGKLIILEGITGSGKTTLSQHVALRLQSLYIRYLLFWENQGDHPLRLTNPWAAPVGDLMAQSQGNWRRFAAWLEQSDATCILDGRLFHIHTDLLFWRHVPEAAIRGHIDIIADAIRPLDPMLVYLYKSDIRAAWTENRKLGNERYFADQLRILDRPYAQAHNTKGRDLEGLITVFADYQPVVDRLFAGLSFKKLSIDTLAGDWANYYDKVWSFLGLPDAPLNRDANRSMVKRVNIAPRKLTVRNRKSATVSLKLMVYKSREIEFVADIPPDAAYELNGMLAERYRLYDGAGHPIEDVILDNDGATLEIL